MKDSYLLESTKNAQILSSLRDKNGRSNNRNRKRIKNPNSKLWKSKLIENNNIWLSGSYALDRPLITKTYYLGLLDKK